MPSQFTYKTTTFSSQNWPKNTPVFQSDSSGKEKDSETGYYYFGARYYNSDLSLWLSVDPMSDKYPSLSPYNYCAWNPLKLVDPDGMDTMFSFATNIDDHRQRKRNKEILSWMRDEGNEPGIVTLGMHGSASEVSLSAADGYLEQSCSASDMARLINKSNLPDYKSNKERKETTIFLLYSCSTGNGNMSFAEQLSGELQSITIAPQGILLVGNKNHTLENVKSRSDKTSQPWNVFYKGRYVTSFNGVLPKDWIKKQGGLENATNKIQEMDRKSHPWE